MSKLVKKQNQEMNKKKRDRSEKERAKQRRRRLINELYEWNSRPCSTTSFLDGRKYQIIKEEFKHANQHYLKIISLDVKMVTLFDGPNKFANKSLWITILDVNGNLLYESLVKYFKNDIKQLNTQFHGLEMHHIKYAIGDNLGDNQIEKLVWTT